MFNVYMQLFIYFSFTIIVFESVCRASVNKYVYIVRGSEPRAAYYEFEYF